MIFSLKSRVTGEEPQEPVTLTEQRPRSSLALGPWGQGRGVLTGHLFPFPKGSTAWAPTSFLGVSPEIRGLGTGRERLDWLGREAALWLWACIAGRAEAG